MKTIGIIPHKKDVLGFHLILDLCFYWKQDVFIQNV